MANRSKIDKPVVADSSYAGNRATEHQVANQAHSLDKPAHAVDIIRLFGTIDIDAQYDYKEQRRRR